MANPADENAYSGSQGVKAGREYLEPVVDAATIPSDAEVEGPISGRKKHITNYNNKTETNQSHIVCFWVLQILV